MLGCDVVPCLNFCLFDSLYEFGRVHIWKTGKIYQYLKSVDGPFRRNTVPQSVCIAVIAWSTLFAFLVRNLFSTRKTLSEGTTLLGKQRFAVDKDCTEAQSKWTP